MLRLHRLSRKNLKNRQGANALNHLRLQRRNLNRTEYTTLRALSSQKESNTRVTQLIDSSIPTRYESANHGNLRTPHINRYRKSEPLIKLDSLSETLEAHQKANQSGVARDGVVVKAARDFSRDPIKKEIYTGAWAGQKVLHFQAQDNVPEESIPRSGVSQPLSSEWRPVTCLPYALRLPWMSRAEFAENGISCETSLERLNAEIQACAEYFTPSLPEQQAATHAFSEIAEIITAALGADIAIDLIGSRKVGTARPTSDLDINIRLQNKARNGNQSQFTLLNIRALDRAIRKPGYTDSVVPHAYIRKTHVPIVTGTHLASGLEFQIQSTNNAYDSQEVTKAFVAEYPAACILFKIVKQMLLMRGLTKGWLGGITSYPLLNMVVASLKLANISKHDVASQLLHFLAFWSDFDFDKNRIAFVSPGVKDSEMQGTQRAIDPISQIPIVIAKSDNYKASRHMISLEDPADATNDLGENCHEVQNIQAFFAEAQHRLQRSMAMWDRHLTDHDGNEARKSILSCCIGGDYTSYAEARWQLTRYGQRLQIGKEFSTRGKGYESCL